MLRSAPTTSRAAIVTRSSRRSTVTVRAWAGDNAPWAGLLRFFVSRKALNVKDDSWPETNWTKGNISRERKPFKDGFMGKRPSSRAAVAQVAEAPADDAASAGGPLDYLNQAAERVIKHNFKGEASEPEWGQMGAGARGWTGEIRSTRDRKEKGGFHANVM